MATNNFKPFAIGAGANVLAQADYEALSALASGFLAGKASSNQINKALRQGTAMAAVLAQFIAESSGNDVLDNGSTAVILANLISGFLASATGRLIGVKTFTSSGTYTPSLGTKSIIIEVQGAGGGGGGTTATASGIASCTGAGGSGAYAKHFLSSPVATSVLVGAGGSAGTAGSAGSNGGASSFGSIVVCPGGIGGGSENKGTSNFDRGGSLATAAPTGGNILSTAGTAGAGSNGFTTSFGSPGSGASSMMGMGGVGGVGGSNAGSGLGPGAGGGGLYQAQSLSASNGGVGAPGIVIIWEYS